VLCNPEAAKSFAYEVLLKFRDPIEDKLKDFKKDYNEFIQNPRGF